MRRRAGLCGVIALIFWLGGCASPPVLAPDPTPADLPSAWSQPGAGTGDATALAGWWLRLRDPLLAQLVEQALRANTTITGAQATLREARALSDVSAAALSPAVSGSASAQRSRSGNDGSSNRFQAGLDASWEIDVFGARRDAVAASEAAARASAADLGATQVSIAAEVALNYIALRGAESRLVVANANLASQLETLQITQWRLQAGLVTSLVAQQALAGAEQTRAQLPLQQTSIVQLRHALSVLTGRPPAALTEMLAEAAPVPVADDALVLAFPAETLRQRPDVRAAEHRLEQAWARVAQAQAARLPAFRLTGSLGLNALTLGALTGGAAVTGALLAGVSMPLLDGGAGRAQVKAQQAALDQSHAAYRAVVLVALKDVEDALAALRGDRERLARLQRAATAAAQAARLARQLFGSGLVDFQAVLETQRSQLATQDAVASVNADLASDHVRLYKALGGGWEPGA